MAAFAVAVCIGVLAIISQTRQQVERVAPPPRAAAATTPPDASPGPRSSISDIVEQYKDMPRTMLIPENWRGGRTFAAQVVAAGQPRILRNTSLAASQWRAVNRWTPQYLSRVAGDTVLQHVYTGVLPTFGPYFDSSRPMSRYLLLLSAPPSRHCAFTSSWTAALHLYTVVPSFIKMNP